MTAIPVAPGSGTAWLPDLTQGFLPRASEDDVDLTPLALALVVPTLREAVQRFDEALNPIHDHETVRVVTAGDARKWISNIYMPGPIHVVTIGETTSVMERASSVDPETAEPLAVFDRLRSELGVTQEELLAATGIKRRTYYSWKKPNAPRPRPASVGALWNLADAMVDLREEIDRPVAAWLHALPERMAALREGRFDDLVDLAVAMPKPAKRGMGTSRRMGVSPDVDVPIVNTGKPKVTVVQRGARR
ncbi:MULTISPECIES: helix-turn-helix transcriptional regulator [Arthrobacter]|uniref:XRE family transcriptional regulator n=1 Tax=Arthrobacter terricola TaxID=2547396 RepID=A0A4R5K9E2_9MICC|nr:MULTISPECIES: helix-turn-helix transcriptional regulator [Arthrobacter]MBT8163487.1 helix-turn-helix transcriptional regulator [Arthrobacter sp. GN70]TDF89467.1 XRE family transcriptional regulator [Arthrobacter terricola]